MSVLFCDSNCELWHDKVDRYRINVIEMPYSVENEEYFYDMGRKTDFHAFYEKVRKGSVPMTSALNPQNYCDYFEPYLSKGEDIIYITFSHELSGTFNFMKMALGELNAKYPERKIHILDSKNISGGNAIIVYEAAKMKAAGKADEEIIAAVNELIGKTASYFTVDNLHHLKRGGRISGAAAVIGTMFSLKPMLYLTPEGKIESYAKAKGRIKSINMLIEKAGELKIDLSYPVVILDADSPEDGKELYDAFKDAFGSGCEIWRQPVGPVIGTHCGPGTLGLCFVKSKSLFL